LAFSKESLGVENKKSKMNTDDIYNSFKKLGIPAEQI
jgi:hypothetical protein